MTQFSGSWIQSTGPKRYWNTESATVLYHVKDNTLLNSIIWLLEHKKYKNKYWKKKTKVHQHKHYYYYRVAILKVKRNKKRRSIALYAEKNHTTLSNFSYFLKTNTFPILTPIYYSIFANTFFIIRNKQQLRDFTLYK